MGKMGFAGQAQDALTPRTRNFSAIGKRNRLTATAEFKALMPSGAPRWACSFPASSPGSTWVSASIPVGRQSAYVT